MLSFIVGCNDGNKKNTPINVYELDWTITEPAADVDIFEGYFSKYVNIYGIHIFATTTTANIKINHAANVLAQYIDNDEDGTPDNQAVLDSLIKYHPSLVMFATENQAEQFFDDPSETAMEMFDNGQLIAQDLYGEETILPGTSNRFDASLEEIWHLVTNGYMMVYPDVFGDWAGTDIANNMDLARGGHFTSIPNNYPEAAWYHYDDWTCDYGCMVVEYFYWALTTLLGAQSDPDRCADISVEWELCTADQLESGDPGMFSLLTDPQYNLPTVLPDGSYGN
jgi:hypothetical protein